MRLRIIGHLLWVPLQPRITFGYCYCLMRPDGQNRFNPEQQPMKNTKIIKSACASWNNGTYQGTPKRQGSLMFRGTPSLGRATLWGSRQLAWCLSVAPGDSSHVTFLHLSIAGVFLQPNQAVNRCLTWVDSDFNQHTRRVPGNHKQWQNNKAFFMKDDNPNHRKHHLNWLTFLTIIPFNLIDMVDVFTISSTNSSSCYCTYSWWTCYHCLLINP